jgi:hypothetical protein
VNNQSALATPRIYYVAFDKQTGHILGMHSRFSIDVKGHVRMNHDELTKLFSGDTSIVSDLTDQDAANLDILEISDGTSTAKSGPLMVDVAHRMIVAQPLLTLLVDRTELRGDGADSITIKLEVRAHNGHVLRSFHGPVKVTTTRGRLSARGGLVEIRNGVGSITLTSVAETVSRVLVQARAVNALCGAGSLTLEFV